jgi:hypothetical protein
VRVLDAPLAGLRAGLAELAARDAPRLASELTLLSLLLAPIGVFDLRALALVLACIGLLAPVAARSPRLWLALAGLAAARVAIDWPLSDNHAYLLAAWCLALAIAQTSPAPEEALARSARLLVALVFGLAVLQKLLAPDYLDGSFFRWLLAADPRFEDLGRLLGRSGDALLQTRAFLEAPPWEAPAEAAAFIETRALRAAARLLTFATLAAEAAVAFAFLAPRRWLPAPLRDATLLLFCMSTYALAPVAGFGWLLLAMGVAQCAPERWRTRSLYLGAAALLVFYREVPWVELFAPAPDAGVR